VIVYKAPLSDSSTPSDLSVDLFGLSGVEREAKVYNAIYSEVEEMSFTCLIQDLHLSYKLNSTTVCTLAVLVPSLDKEGGRR